MLKKKNASDVLPYVKWLGASQANVRSHVFSERILQPVSAD
ncbi:hypothetical protein [Rubripirellula reticaptiva]|nr:hypothetical protein [Rubripirellula reticaptiva]